MAKIVYFILGDNNSNLMRTRTLDNVDIAQSFCWSLLSTHKNLLIEISLEAARLILRSNPHQRVHVYYDEDIDSSQAPVEGVLLDKTIDNVEEECFYYETGKLDCFQANETVSIDKALEVLAYFVKNKTMPSGLAWDGNMYKFS